MENNKAWPWKKKSMEKTIVESKGVSSNGEIEKLVADKIDLENRLKHVSDKLGFAETESQQAMFGWEKTKDEVTSLKKKLEDALSEKHRSEERMHDALTKASQDYERRLVVVKTEVANTGKKHAEVEGENTQLSKALLAKSKNVEDLNREKDRAEDDLNALTSSLESKEKENVSLRYEVRVLEKELELRNEEREFSRRSAEGSHKLHLENVKKVAKLETECHRLRILVRKRLPGPAARSEMRTEVEMLGRRRVNVSTTIDSEKINNLAEQLCLLEEENRTLRDALNKKVNELQFSRNMYSRTASRLVEYESHIEESSSKGGTTNIEPSRSSNTSREFDNDDKVSCDDSWAPALLTEMESFKNKKHMSSGFVRTPKASEMKLMDDFAEMEKLAMVTTKIDNRPGSSPSLDSISATGPVETKYIETSSEITKTPRTQTLAVEVKPDMEYDITKSIRRIADIIEGVSLKDDRHGGESERLSSGYTVRVLQWKTFELSSVLQRFLQACYDLLESKADMKKFAEELSSVLEWMVNHCFSLQDVSSMREEIKKQFEWDESRSGSEVEIRLSGQVSEADKLLKTEDKPGDEEAKDKTASASSNELKLGLDEKQNMRTEMEITAASEKLAECQETILNLGKQIKALATNSKETASLSEKLTPDLTDKSNNLSHAQETKPEKRLTTQRSSLLDQMKAEDHDSEESKIQKPQRTDTNSKGGGSVYNETIEALEHILLSDKTKGSETNCFAIVPQIKSGGVKSLWRKLLGKTKKSKNKKLPNLFAT
ncbi:unnamed protein product [Cochlearia groenlandica]